MKRICFLRLAACTILFSITVACFAEQAGAPEKRGLLFHLGIGTGLVSYGPSIDSELASSSPGRIDSMEVLIGFGFAITKTIYIMLEEYSYLPTYATILSGNIVYLMNLGAGVRLYPFVYGLFVEASYGEIVRGAEGPSWTPMVWNFSSSVFATIGYDFGKKLRGFSFALEANGFYMFNEAEPAYGACVVAVLTMK